MGLLRAIETYDVGHDSGASFYTYSLYWIRNLISRYCKEHDSLIRVPEYAFGKTKLQYCDFELVKKTFRDNS